MCLDVRRPGGNTMAIRIGQTSRETRRGSTLSVLVVDDEQDTRESLTQILQSEFPGCRVVTADDGEEALASLARQRFDLAILDYVIPYVNGMEVARDAMRRQTECILMTAYADLSLAQSIGSDGTFARILHKTASSREIIQVLHQVLDRKDPPGVGRIPRPQSEAP